jgi:hypothetical protein
MHYWLHKFLFSEQYSQEVEDKQRCEDQEMATTIQNFCGNLQQPNCNNDVCQQKTRLDIELDEFWKHLMKISKWKYQEEEEEEEEEEDEKKKKKKSNMQVQLTEGSKEFAQQQSKVWDPGRLQPTTMQQHNNKASGQHHKIWDPGGLQQMKTHD